MKNKIIAITVLCILAVAVLAGCTETSDEHFATLDENITKTSAKYSEVYAKLQALETYKYSAEVYLEIMSNYDDGNKAFPDDKNWYKPGFEYSFVKDGAAEYVSVKFSEQKKNDEGFYTDEYAAPVSYEFWYDGGVLSQIKVDGAAVTAIPAEKEYGYRYFVESFCRSEADVQNLALAVTARYADVEAIKDSVADARTKNILGTNVVNYVMYDIILDGDVIKGYRPLTLDENVSYVNGFGEDLKVDWSVVHKMKISNVCLSTKKDNITMVEMYNEYIYAYHKVESQLWNDSEIIKWYGDRGEADKLVFNFEYPGKKVTVSVPAK